MIHLDRDSQLLKTALFVSLRMRGNYRKGFLSFGVVKL